MTQTRDQIRDYFLGRLSDTGAMAVEDQVFADPANEDLITEVEFDLAGAYVTNRLPSKDRAALDEHFFVSAPRLRLKAELEALARHPQPKPEPWWKRSWALIPAFATALAVLLLAPGHPVSEWAAEIFGLPWAEQPVILAAYNPSTSAKSIEADLPLPWNMESGRRIQPVILAPGHTAQRVRLVNQEDGGRELWAANLADLETRDTAVHLAIPPSAWRGTERKLLRIDFVDASGATTSSFTVRWKRP